MKAAILCPGPSVQKTFRPGQHDRVLGVNRGVFAGKCDEWCFLDPHVVEVIPKRWMTSLDSATTLKHRTHMAPPGVILDQCERLLPLPPDRMLPSGVTPYTFSSTMALASAFASGATEIDVYGADWEVDAPDFDGVNLPTNIRTADRFKEEKIVWDRVVAWLAERGCTVRRILPEKNDVDGQPAGE